MDGDKVDTQFVIDIVGHDKETIEQMYVDWLKSPANSQSILQSLSDLEEKKSILTRLKQLYLYHKKELFRYTEKDSSINLCDKYYAMDIRMITAIRNLIINFDPEFEDAYKVDKQKIGE